MKKTIIFLGLFILSATVASAQQLISHVPSTDPSKVLKAGDTMSGTLNVGGHDISNFGALSGGTLYASATTAMVASGTVQINGPLTIGSTGHGYDVSYNSSSLENSVLYWSSSLASLKSGYSNTASGLHSVAFGQDDTASGAVSAAIGDPCQATGANDTAMGTYVVNTGVFSAAIGYYITIAAGGGVDEVFGAENSSNGWGTDILGNWDSSTGDNSTVLGNYISSTLTNMTIGSGVSAGSKLANTIAGSIMLGMNSTIPTLTILTAAGAGTVGTVQIGGSATAPSACSAAGDGGKIGYNSAAKVFCGCDETSWKIIGTATACGSGW